MQYVGCWCVLDEIFQARPIPGIIYRSELFLQIADLVHVVNEGCQHHLFIRTNQFYCFLLVMRGKCQYGCLPGRGFFSGQKNFQCF